MICVLDTETNGFPGVAKTSVIELGAVVLTDDGEEKGTFNSLVQPVHPLGAWCARAMAVNQIDPVALAGAPSRASVWEQFLSWLSEHKPVTSVLAFNVTFDKKAMEKTFPGAEHLPWGSCLMRDANHALYGTRQSVKLEVAARAFGLSIPENTHRALWDARLAGQIYRALQTV
jgi:DNA polymerase III epsilon subunit-like protein